MQVIQANNTEHALRLGLQLLHQHGQREDSRNGPVLVAPWPVVTATRNPRQRVVRAGWRDANPFFHLVEAAWMLAGRSDVASLTPYVKRFAQYAEDDGQVHGAYGRRWRSALGIDQLNVVVRRLKLDPADRQCVLQMWDANVEGDAANHDLAGTWRDRPCNTHAYLRLRGMQEDDWRGHSTYLDLTVCCRSNDMLWGAHGANAVHFSFLQEYLADRVGAGVGKLYQVSNNYHAYTQELDRMVRRCYQHSSSANWSDDGHGLWLREKAVGYPTVQPMRRDGEPAIDTELERLWSYLDVLHVDESLPADFVAPTFAVAFSRLVWQVALAHHYWRHGDQHGAEQTVMGVRDDDWRDACLGWLRRRTKVEVAHAGA